MISKLAYYSSCEIPASLHVITYVVPKRLLRRCLAFALSLSLSTGFSADVGQRPGSDRGPTAVSGRGPTAVSGRGQTAVRPRSAAGVRPRSDRGLTAFVLSLSLYRLLS